MTLGRRGQVAAFMVLLVGCTAPSARPAPPSTPLRRETIFILSNLHGALDPCGCSEHMQGGLARVAQVIAEARREGHPVHVVDTGDALFEAKVVPEASVGQSERKAATMAEVFRALGVEGTVPGPLDDARGAAFREAQRLPAVVTEQQLSTDVALIVSPSAAEVAQRTQQAKAAGARFVAAVVLDGYEGALSALKGGPELLIAARASDPMALEENKLIGGPAKLVQVQSKGRSIVRVDLAFRDGTTFEWLKSPAQRDRELTSLAQRVELLRAQLNEPGLDPTLKAMRAEKLDEVIARREGLAAAPLPIPDDHSSGMVRFVTIESSIPELPVVRALLSTYDRDVGRLNVAQAEKENRVCAPGAAPAGAYVGSEACGSCHAAALTVWKTTKHAGAYQALENAGKQHHLDCVGCHVTGWLKPGGPCRIDRPGASVQVGCEACHGPGGAHVKTGSKTMRTGLDASACTGCHDRDNSPHFSFEAYVAQVLGPGHGR